jgi:predicted amidohydrolase
MAERAFTVACVQLRCGREVGPNIETARRLVREAADAGADLIVTPEQTGLMELDRASLFAKLADEAGDETLAALGEVAREVGRHLVIGSLAIRLDGERAVNRSFVVGPTGAVLARYDKIHMFDVDLQGGESYRESRSYRPGGEAVLVDLPWGRCGLTICYDLRFAALYRALAHGGADFLTVPSAFTRVTGAAHWHVLLRARAIETGCFVFAAAQGGRHENGRATYGHSLIVSPWGEIIAEAGTEPGIITARVDPAEVAEARGRIPALTHDRPFALAGPRADAAPGGERAAS